MNATKEKEKFTLFTNLSYVSYNDVRFHCHALLLSEGGENFFGDRDKKQYTLRGFGTDPAWEAFDMRLSKASLPYALDAGDSRASAVMLGGDGEVKPLMSGAILTFADGKRFTLWADTTEAPIDVFKSEGDIGVVWNTLFDKATQYWHAPYMPSLQYGPPALRRNKYAPDFCQPSTLATKS